MKLRHALIIAIVSILLAACNFTLAADVTPPPGYVPPTPMPTLGPLFPASAPDIQNGAVIYAQKCAACHGDTGLGDGPDGKQLPVTVAALGLPEVAHKAKPAQWFSMVTQGNLERFMPPFTSLSDQQRWDVIAYAFTLHTTSQQIETGRAILEERCADCADALNHQEKMAALSADDLVRIIKNGDTDIPAFGSDLSDADAYAVAAYLRTLTFASPLAAPTTVPVSPKAAVVSETPVSTDAAGTPSAVETPLGGTAQATLSAAEGTVEATAIAGVGPVTGRIVNETGKKLPSNTKVILRGYDHGGDLNAGPQEVLAIEGTAETDGTYRFENVEIPESRIFLAEAEINDLTYQSQFVIVEAGAAEVTVPDIVAYATTDDYTSLSVDALQIFFDYANADNVQVFTVYSIMNTTDKTILVKMGDQQEVPFVKFPEGAEGQGYEATQDTAPFVPTADGFAMPPSETPYGLIAFASYPKDSKIEFSQTVSLPVTNSVIFVPEGVTAKADEITDGGVQAIQGTNFQIYEGGPMKAGDVLTFTLSGKPENASGDGAGGAPADLTQNKNLLIIVGLFGLLLVVAGVWLYVRDRNRVEEDVEEEDDEFEDTESVLDAIIALDDLHRAGKLSDEAYRKRREELKAKLKEEN